MSTIASIFVRVGADMTGLTGGLATGARSVTAFAQTTTTAGARASTALGSAVPLAAVAGGLAVVAFAAKSVQAARDFDAAFTRIGAISNASAQDISRWKDEVMGLAGETARAPAELADALFYLSSAGLDSGQIMDTLSLSAKAAAVGLGSTTDIAKITANALNAYADAGLTAAQVTDTLVAAVREGSAEPEEFAAALGRILPIASQAGVSFDEVTASLAALSNVGLDVNEGVTAMRGLMTALVAPTQQSQDAMKQLGLTSDELRRSLSEDGLIATLRMLEERTGGNIDVMKALVPNVRALTGAFGLTGQEAAKVDAIFENVLNSTGSLAAAWQETANSDAFRLEKAFNDLGIAGQELASTVLPLLADGAALAADSLGSIVIALGALLLMRVLPALLFQVALGLEAVGAAKTASGIGNVAGGLQALSGMAGFAAIAIGLVAFGIHTMSQDAENNRQIVAGWTAALLDGSLGVAQLDFMIRKATADAPDFADATFKAMGEAAKALALLTEALAPVPEALGLVQSGLLGAGSNAQDYGVILEETAQRTANFAGMTNDELTKFREDVSSSMEDAIGSLDGFQRKWDITAAAALRAMEGMAVKAGQMARDFKALDTDAVPERFKQFLLEEGPAAVHAFVEGTRSQKERFLEAWRSYEDGMKGSVDRMEAIAARGGRVAGGVLTDEMRAAILGGLLSVANAAAAVAQAAVDAAMAALTIGPSSNGPSSYGPSSAVPALAAGGIVTGPTLALLGERGPEAVVPLNGLQAMPSVGGGGIDYRALGAALAQALAEQPAKVIGVPIDPEMARRGVMGAAARLGGARTSR